METHFNATTLFKAVENKPKGVKISQFLDNRLITQLMSNITSKPITTKGRSGETMLPIELLHLYTEWLSLLGSGRGNSKFTVKMKEYEQWKQENISN